MSGLSITFTSYARWPAIAAVLVLPGCGENGFGLFSGTGGTASPTQIVQMVEREVEAPEAFEVREAALWDGVQTLGGVWVAHPGVSEPERVIIRNAAAETFVIGALFRQDDPTGGGPRLRVSSDAAEALGMTPDTPTELQVTALRREGSSSRPEAQPTATFNDGNDISVAPLESGLVDVETSPQPVEITGVEAALEAAGAAPDPASTLDKPFIQIGIFSVEGNATRTADQMRAAGLQPTVLQQESQGRAFWRVITGPAANEAARAAALVQIRQMGFEDAYFVRN